MAWNVWKYYALKEQFKFLQKSVYSPEWKKRGVVDAEVLRYKIIYISKFRKDIKPLKIKFRKAIRNGARIYTPE